MRNYNFVIFLISVGIWLASGEKDSSEKTTPIESSNSSETTSDPKTTERLSNDIPPTNQRRSHQRLTPKHRHTQKLHHSQLPPRGDPAIPHLGFPDSPRQRIYFSDYTGDYDLRLHNIRQGQPTEFQAALGAISAHILNQKNNQEYVPYPPNGVPYNYPAYRGAPRATEPPAVRAYERATKSNYYIRPTTDLDHRHPSRLLSIDDYRPNEFQNLAPSFYSDPGSFNRGQPMRPYLFV